MKNQKKDIFCTFCKKEVNIDELTYTEDAEASHKKCLKKFEQHWEDRSEYMDLLGH